MTVRITVIIAAVREAEILNVRQLEIIATFETSLRSTGKGEAQLWQESRDLWSLGLS
jgi:hypothetical protein